MRLSTQIRRRRVNYNASTVSQQEKLLTMLEEQQQKSYENLRLHFTGLAFQGLNADPMVLANVKCVQVALERGKSMADAWVASL